MATEPQDLLVFYEDGIIGMLTFEINHSMTVKCSLITTLLRQFVYVSEFTWSDALTLGL